MNTTPDRAVAAIDAAMARAFPRFGHDVCEWARVMVGAHRARLPVVRHDRLRAAAEFRLELARRIRAGWYAGPLPAPAATL